MQNTTDKQLQLYTALPWIPPYIRNEIRSLMRQIVRKAFWYKDNFKFVPVPFDNVIKDDLIKLYNMGITNDEMLRSLGFDECANCKIGTMAAAAAGGGK